MKMTPHTSQLSSNSIPVAPSVKPSLDVEKLVKPFVHLNEPFPESFEELLFHQWTLGANLIANKRDLNLDGRVGEKNEIFNFILFNFLFFNRIFSC